MEGFTEEKWEKERGKTKQNREKSKCSSREAGQRREHSRSIWRFGWADVRVGEFKDFATAVRACLLLKRHKNNFCCCSFYTVESEVANYWQMKKEVSLRKGTDETRLAQRSFS